MTRITPRLSSGLKVGFSGLFIIVLLTFRSFNDTAFYANWLSSFLAILLFLIIVSVISRITKDQVAVLLLFTAWIVWSLIITPLHWNTPNHLKVLLVSAFCTISGLLFSFLFLSEESLFYSVVKASFYAWVITNLILLFLFFFGVYVPAKRDFSGVFHDRNVFAITSLIVTAMYASLYLNRVAIKQNIPGYIFALLSIVMVLVSKSVTGLVGLSAVLIIYTLSQRTVRKISLIIVGVIFSVAILFTDNPISNRIDRFYMSATGQMEELRQNESAYIRRHLLVNGFKLAISNPVFGVGLDNARYHVYWPGKSTGSFLHNNYLDIATSGGVILFLTYYFPIFYCFIGLKRIKQAVSTKLDKTYSDLRLLGFTLITLKLLYDFTWTTYFEFSMSFSVTLAAVIYFRLKRLLRQANLT